ncbi:MAG: M48 family metalloprotease [Snowella sp.]|nr:M48 family metalloprotease [Snowella sp.]
MSPQESLEELQKGLQSLQRQNYPDAIAYLENFCKYFPDNESPYFVQAEMSLVRAYRGQGEQEKAIALCQSLAHSPNQEVASWARSLFKILTIDEKNSNELGSTEQYFFNGPRADETNVKIVMPRVADSLKFAEVITLIFPFVAVFIVLFGFSWLLFRPNLVFAGLYSLLASLFINGLFFLLSTWLIDQIQEQFYQTRWGTFNEIQRYSPETGDFLLRFCREKRIKLPRLGIVEDGRPIAFTYGINANEARLVVSRGLLESLTDDEIAVIYTHELGHILNRDFRVMTLVSGWGQCFYFLYLGCEKLAQKSKTWHAIAFILALPCYGLFQLNNLLNTYLSRTREYYADHFAITHTGNPNALVRALVKIPLIRIQQELNATQAAPFLVGMQNFSVCFPKTSMGAEKTSQLNPQNLGKLLLWDLLNPWSFFLELISSHPLIGKRIQVLTHYAEQMDLRTELNMTQMQQDASNINRNILYLSFFLELGLVSFPLLGFIAGLIFFFNPQFMALHLLNPIFFGIGLGLLCQVAIATLFSGKPIDTDLQSLCYSPYPSPFWSRLVQWQGQLQAVSYSTLWGKPLYFHDDKAIIPVRHNLFGKVWQKLFKHHSSGVLMLESLMEIQGGFRRRLSSYLELKSIVNDEISITSYPQLWKLIVAIAIILLGFIIK